MFWVVFCWKRRSISSKSPPVCVDGVLVIWLVYNSVKKSIAKDVCLRFFANCCRVNALFLGFCYYLYVFVLRIKEILVKFPFFGCSLCYFPPSVKCLKSLFIVSGQNFLRNQWDSSSFTDFHLDVWRRSTFFCFVFFCFISNHSPLLHVTTIALSSHHWLCATGCQDIWATRDYFLSHLSCFFMSVGVFFEEFMKYP